jgi:hypothetical protein
MDLQEWMAHYPPKRKSPGPVSEFAKYESEIRILHEKGYTQRDILRYLRNEKGLVLTQPALTRWMKRQKITGKDNP